MSFGIKVDGPRGAPWLVLANSLGATASMWDPQMPFLTDRFRVVRYEHPGHGGTEPPVEVGTMAAIGGRLLAVLDEVGADRASVVGLSLGGTAAIWLAASQPTRVDRLVLASTAAHWPPAQAWYDRMELVRSKGTGALLEILLSRWFTEGFLDAHPGTRELVAGMLAEASPDGYAQCCAALAQADLRPDLRLIRAPTIVLAGTTDPAVPLSSTIDLAQAIGGVSVEVMSPGAHLLNVEQPERFTSAVLDHLLGPPTERGLSVRRAVLGADHVERSELAVGPHSRAFSDLVNRYAWGETWTRPGLDRRTRSCMTLAMLVALGRFDELEFHLLAARRNGLEDREISEVLLQSAIYCGVPAANTAFNVARRILGDGARW